jgi:Calcium-binding EGF domain
MFLTKAQKNIIFRATLIAGAAFITTIVVLLVHPSSPIALPSSTSPSLAESSSKPPQDVDECASRIHNCHLQFGICTNTIGSFTCRCIDNYSGDGVNCFENECLTGRNNCHPNATCTDTQEGYYCTCKGSYDNKWPGSRGENPPYFAGNGTFCDMNQCADISMNRCFAYPNRTFVDYTVSANCTDTLGDPGYTCQCLPGFVIDSSEGRSCTLDGAAQCQTAPCDRNTTDCVSEIDLVSRPYHKPRLGMDPKCKVAFPYCCDCKYPDNQTRIK